VAWQEPISALSTYRQQRALGGELGRTESALFSPDSLLRLERIGTQRQRMAILAGQMERRTSPGSALGHIAIPRIGATFVFVEGSGSKSLEKGPGHYVNTVLPGQSGTVGIAGHRTTYLAPFRHIDRLRRGDQIALSMPYGRFSYAVEGSRVASPSNSAALRPVRGSRLVLTTCTPLFSAAKRLVVTARLKSTVPAGPAVGDPFPLQFSKTGALPAEPHGVGPKKRHNRKATRLARRRLGHHSKAEIMPTPLKDVAAMHWALHPSRH
jgi:sortase A